MTWTAPRKLRRALAEAGFNPRTRFGAIGSHPKKEGTLAMQFPP
jgi:hypothetical protein